MPTRQTRLLAAALTILPLFVAAQTTRAQSAGGWITFAPAGESFSVSLPFEPSVKSQNALPSVGSAAGRLYAAKRDSAEYLVWSLKSETPVGNDAQSVSDTLDSCAEMAWTLFVSPEIERSRRAGSRDDYARYGMTYLLGTAFGTTQHAYYAREYAVFLGARHGRAYLLGDGANDYVALAFGQGIVGDADVRTFLSSFTIRSPEFKEMKILSPEDTGGRVGGPPALSSSQVTNAARLPAATAVESEPTLFPPNPHPPPYGDPKSKSNVVGSTGGSKNSADSATPPVSCDELSKGGFNATEVTRKAQILARPEPTYTESARKFGVQGTVRLSGRLSNDGTVTNVIILIRLPHGLTRKALEAFHAVSFEPAQKDGCKVSQYVTIDYNFNIY
jgi:TonB family protein